MGSGDRPPEGVSHPGPANHISANQSRPKDSQFVPVRWTFHNGLVLIVTVTFDSPSILLSFFLTPRGDWGAVQFGPFRFYYLTFFVPFISSWSVILGFICQSVAGFCHQESNPARKVFYSIWEGLVSGTRKSIGQIVTKLDRGNETYPVRAELSQYICFSQSVCAHVRTNWPLRGVKWAPHHVGNSRLGLSFYLVSSTLGFLELIVVNWFKSYGQLLWRARSPVRC